MKVIGMDAKFRNPLSSTLLKTIFSTPVTSLKAHGYALLHHSGIIDAFCQPTDENRTLESFQRYNDLKAKLNTTDQLILRQCFEQFLLYNFLQDWISNLEQSFSSYVDYINNISDSDIFSDMSSISDISPYSCDSPDLSQRYLNSYIDKSCVSQPLHWEQQLGREIDSDIFQNRLSQFNEVIHTKTSLSPIQEETVSDVDSLITNASFLPRELSPNIIHETIPIRKSEFATNDVNSDSDYIDLYDPKLPSGSKLFKCEQCRIRFNAEQHLMIHLEHHKLFQHMKLFKCQYNNCNASFVSESQYVQHVTFHLLMLNLENLQRNRHQENDLKRKLVDLESGSDHESSSKRHCDTQIKSYDYGFYGLNYTHGKYSSESLHVKESFKCDVIDCKETFLTKFELACHLGTHFGTL